MTTYYRGTDVLITDRVFYVLVPFPMRFPINQLQDAHVVSHQGRFPWQPPVLELRATYGATTLTLFRTSDVTVFGQVRRALLRVLERQRDQWERECHKYVGGVY
jgi:hypothetical protein